MKRKLFVFTLLFLLALLPSLRADEGMWIPMLIEKLNIQQMHEKGFKLSAEDIYSVNKASMKDAVMIFGGGCTAELISGDGLLITNHHCGYRSIQPSFYINIHSKYKDNYQKYMEIVYGKTLFSDSSRVFKILDSPGMADIAKIKKDPVYLIYHSADNLYKNKILPEYNRLGLELNRLNRIYMAGQMAFQKDKIFYPDANFTLRLTYGEVKGYVPGDAVFYKHYSTVKGIMEKDNPFIYDYDVPPKLKELYEQKDFGRYAEDGEMHVCFLATNHTTGGNSGSPVLNAEGQLTGVNFDRAWEGVMSDLMFNPNQCRNISLDIRYALFLIDKFAGAGYLLDEMEIVE